MAPYSVNYDLVTNLAKINELIINWKLIDNLKKVWPKENAQKWTQISCFLGWIFLKVCTVQDKVYTFLILYFKIFYRTNFFKC